MIGSASNFSAEDLSRDWNATDFDLDEDDAVI